MINLLAYEMCQRSYFDWELCKENNAVPAYHWRLFQHTYPMGNMVIPMTNHQPNLYTVFMNRLRHKIAKVIKWTQITDLKQMDILSATFIYKGSKYPTDWRGIIKISSFVSGVWLWWWYQIRSTFKKLHVGVFYILFVYRFCNI